MFLAPVLYIIHALLTGVSMVIMDMLHVKLGFGFSAGLFDYVLNYGKASNPLLLLPVGAAYFAIYYGLFRFFIAKFDLKTMGREADSVAAAPVPAGEATTGSLGPAYVRALGGAANLLAVDACTTRLRLSVADNAAIDEAALKSLGARGVIKPAPGSVQVVVGPIADQLAGEVNAALRLPLAS
jgi:PTS system N-acetylglucosamine-specific IIC component